ncbi:hypothetical protein ACFVWN_15925 [Nocardiopsis flavescens]|uniref:Uncharacterized protein n=1 Tax=Nocardiopsis flavescens TaxID=758803 RepID=A0A1M6FL27_9ACTN|nr:hypothetical protein [Nocardiopsis flavescens]SHI98395.1 hypothetical protein SAMN05421803_10371 [Nocardiopsis flavescens]
MTTSNVFAVSSRQQWLNAVPGTALSECGLPGGSALRGERAIAGGAHGGTGTVSVVGALRGTGVEGTGLGFGGFGVRPVTTVILAAKAEHEGSGVSTGNESARDRGDLMTARTEGTPRRYGAPGKCPRRIPA